MGPCLFLGASESIEYLKSNSKLRSTAPKIEELLERIDKKIQRVVEREDISQAAYLPVDYPEDSESSVFEVYQWILETFLRKKGLFGEEDSEFTSNSIQKLVKTSIGGGQVDQNLLSSCLLI